jgi:hypothetical protein
MRQLLQMLWRPHSPGRCTVVSIGCAVRRCTVRAGRPEGCCIRNLFKVELCRVCVAGWATDGRSADVIDMHARLPTSMPCVARWFYCCHTAVALECVAVRIAPLAQCCCSGGVGPGWKSGRADWLVLTHY